MGLFNEFLYACHQGWTAPWLREFRRALAEPDDGISGSRFELVHPPEEVAESVRRELDSY